MKFTVILLLAVLTAPVFARAQDNILKGIIKDAANGKPLAGVSVFLNGTSRGTASREDGSFVLQGFPQGQYQLIVSAIGYATYITTINSHQLPPSLEISLHTAASQLTAVTVEPTLEDGWLHYGKTFLQCFIGTTGNAFSCTIKNKNVLQFHYSPRSDKLSVTATDPLLIENKALGYEVEYRLESFVCDFASSVVSYYGYPLFRDMPAKDNAQKRKWEINRRQAYIGSIRHFMRSLYNHRLQEDGFQVQYKTGVPNIEKERVKQFFHSNITLIKPVPPDTLHYYSEVLREPNSYMATVTDPDRLLTIQKDQTRVLFFTDDCTVIYGNLKREKSSIRLENAKPVTIDENGNYYPPTEIRVLQNWSVTNNISNLLPLDYNPDAPF